MDRNGGSILTGTLLISLLLTPAVRSRLASPGDTGGGTESTGQNQSNGHSGAALRAEQKWSDRKRQAVEDQAKTDYRDEFNRVLNAACPKKDNKSACQVQPKDFIVAILPDPIHTHLALRFDRQIEAIEESVQDEDYIYDRAIMPWDTKVHRESDDHEKRLEALWYEEAREKNPGLMVFRGDSKHPQKALFVVIVTETPTGGVRRQQFREAIAKISDATKKDLSRPESWGPNPGPGCSTQQGEKLPECAPRGLRIVGPSFSGSLASLRELLTCTPSAKGHCPSVPLASIHASVSSHDDISSFEEAMQPQNVHLVSFLESSDIVIERFVEYLAGTAYLDPTRSESRNYRAKSIALLSEDESVYGRMQKDKSSSPEIQQKALRESDCDKKENSKEQQCMLKLYFPREISQLRAAYQKDIAGASDNNANAPPRDILRATPDVPGSEDDTVPVYSSKQMPLSQEAVMLGIVSELRRHNSQYILIRATDPLDQLFLARYLRTEYPQGRIVTIGADMLFRREAEDPRLHGVLALTTYSVVPTANHNFKSSEDEHIERVFPSSNEAATYNAMRSLLTAWVSDSVEICQHGEDLLKGSHCRHVLKRYTQEDDPNPRPSLRLYQYGWPYEVLERPGHAAPTVDDKLEQQPIFNEAPPVRLLALGRDDYWPVANLGPYQAEKLSSTLPRVPNQLVDHDLEPIEIPTSWRVVQLLGIALGLGFAGSLWFSSLFSRTQMLAKYAPAENDSRSTVIVVAGLALVLSLLTLLWPWMHGAESKKQLVEYALIATIVLVLLSVVVELVNRWVLSWSSGSSSGKFLGRFRGLIPILIFLALCLFFAWRTSKTILETSSLLLRFGTLRAIQLASGLSFIMPFFFLLMVWLWRADHIVAGSVLLDERRPRLPEGMRNYRVLGLSEDALSGLQDVHDLSSGRDPRYWVILVIFIGGYWMLGDLSHPVLTLERPFLEKALTLCLALAIAGIIAATLKLSEIWVATRQILVSLDSLPLRRGFERIKGFSWDPIWRLGAGSLEEFQRMFSREKEALECAMKTVPITDTKLDEQMAAMVKTWCQAKTTPHPFTIGWWQRRKAELLLLRQFGVYQEEVARVAGAALDYLASSWPDQKEASSEENGNGATPAIRACERFVCLVYINFLLVILVRIRTLAVAIGGMYVLTLIAISQYPFEPKGALQVMLVLLLAVVVYIVGSVYAQIHRDATLSAITDSTPGELGLDFWLRMVSFTALPLISLLASQFPSINRFFYSWFQPAVEALNR